MSGNRRRLRDKIQTKHIVELFDISRDAVNNAKNNGELVFGKNGWIDTKQVKAWAAKRGIGLRGGGEPTQIIEANGKVSGGGFLPDTMLERMKEINIPSQIVENAEDAERTSKALIGMIAAQEKQTKLLKDAGRLADLKEAQAVIDELLALLVMTAKSLGDELAASIARKRKMKTGDVKGVLDDAGKHLMQTYEAAAADLEARAQAFEDEKAAEVKQRQRGR